MMTPARQSGIMSQWRPRFGLSGSENASIKSGVVGGRSAKSEMAASRSGRATGPGLPRAPPWRA
eukprot:5000718-Pyramimonas_sp.AAC.1